MGIVAALNTYDEAYWDFESLTNNGVHSIANYPAPMVAPMQRELLSIILKNTTGYKKMLDPFHGSGITLVEGQSLGLEVWGCDINPYAHIITLAKLEKYNPRIIKTANRRIMKRIDRIKQKNLAVPHSFYNITKWFRDDIIDELCVIRTAISKEPNAKTRRYYWLCFGEIVKQYSNTRNSTFKLHVKEEARINEMKNNVINDFHNKIDSTYILIGYPKQGPYQLSCGDSIDVMSSYSEDFFDIICTSPPYGDNATTVTYGQFSTLQLLWIDSADFKYDSDCVENYSTIDSMSLGGAYSTNEASFTSKTILSYTSRLAEHKQPKVSRFYADYENVFKNMVRVLKPNGYMVLTLANRTVDRQEFPFIDINIELAKHYKLEYVYSLNRNILNKRMPYRVSRLSDGKPVNSMSKETVLLFRKEKKK